MLCCFQDAQQGMCTRCQWAVYCFLTRNTFPPSALRKEKNGISKKSKLVRNLEITYSRFSQNLRPWRRTYEASMTLQSILRKSPLLQVFPFWLTQGKASQLLTLSSERKRWPQPRTLTGHWYSPSRYSCILTRQIYFSKLIIYILVNLIISLWWNKSAFTLYLCSLIFKCFSINSGLCILNKLFLIWTPGRSTWHMRPWSRHNTWRELCPISNLHQKCALSSHFNMPGLTYPLQSMAFYNYD